MKRINPLRQRRRRGSGVVGGEEHRAAVPTRRWGEATHAEEGLYFASRRCPFLCKRRNAQKVVSCEAEILLQLGLEHEEVGVKKTCLEVSVTIQIQVSA